MLLPLKALINGIALLMQPIVYCPGAGPRVQGIGGPLLHKAPSLRGGPSVRASAVFLVSVSPLPECENFMAHYLPGGDEVTGDLWGAKNRVWTRDIFILLCRGPASPLRPQEQRIRSAGHWRGPRALVKARLSDRRPLLLI